jgi:hypothetical protein
MAKPTTRSELADYCLRALGAPVVEINIDDDQIEDRIDEAIQFWQEYHSDAAVRTLIKHEVTAGELASNEIEVPDAVLSIVRVLEFQDFSSASLFNAKYQMYLNDFFGMRNPGGLLNYELTSQYMSLVEDILNGHGQAMSFNRHKNTVKFHADIADHVAEGDFIIFETFQTVNPSSYPDVFDDMGLKELLTLLIKKQWGQNLSKFEGMQLPGGVTINGSAIYEQATADIKELKETWQLKYEEPLDIFIG